VVAGARWWGPVCAFASGLAIVLVAARRRDAAALGAGLCLVTAFAAFAGQLAFGPLRPGEFLHLGLALGMLFLGRWAARRRRGSA
jgi:hypothetical protein